MTSNTTLERIKAADPVPSTGSFPAGAMSSEALLARIDERSTNVTDIKTAPRANTEPEPPNRWRGPAIAMAVAAGILLIVGIISVVSLNTTDTEPAAPTPEDTNALTDPLAVVAEYNRLYDSGDIGHTDFYSDDPEIQDEAVNPGLSQYIAATGMTVSHECTADGERVECTTVQTSGINPSLTYPPLTSTLVVVDGKIAEVGTNADYLNPMWADRVALAQYIEWVRDNHPDKYDDLILFGTTLIIDTVETQRLQGLMIQQYHEATGAGQAQAVDGSIDPLEVVLRNHEYWNAADFDAWLENAPFWATVPDHWMSEQRQAMWYSHVTGLTATWDCSADGPTVICAFDHVSGLTPGAALRTGVAGYTVDGGRIVDAYAIGEDVSLLAEDAAHRELYRSWVSENRADVYDDLFRPQMYLGAEEARELHRSVIAEYHAATSDPLAVVAEYNARHDAGDHAGFEAILDPESPGLFEYEFSSRRSSTYLAVTGMTIDYDCAAEGNVVTCSTTRTSGLNPSVVYEPFVVTTVVENGLIVANDVGPGFDWTYSVDSDEFEMYQAWVSENHADKYDDLFLRDLLITNTAEEIRLHKQMVQQYLEATRS